MFNNSVLTKQIVAQRPTIDRPTPSTSPIDVLAEQEAIDTSGRIADVTTVLLRGSECSFRCTMCDLWKSTHLGPTPPGNIPAQIRSALERLSSASNSQNERWIKLYNASNFFSPYNVPTEDLPEIAIRVRNFDRVIVENHPSLTSPSIASFAQQINGRLEVAMGLETVDSTVLRMLNKQVDVEDVRAATLKLIDMQVDVRLFVLLRPPCQSESAGIESCLASIEAAREWGARHVSIIPVRAGNGIMEQLQASGDFEPPLASSLEFVLRESIARSSLVVTADTWDWSHMRGLCEHCVDARRAAIERANLTQVAAPVMQCDRCG